MGSMWEESSLLAFWQFLGIMNPNMRITSSLLDGNNYKEWAYLARMAIGGAKKLGYIDRSIVEAEKKDPKYSD